MFGYSGLRKKGIKTMRTMGEIISNQRKEKGMTQAELAAIMNITDKAVSKWERNLSCPDVNSISKLAEALDIPVDELLSAKKPENQNAGAGETIGVILKVIPLAMGVAVVVLSAMKELDVNSAISMLGIGVLCLGAGALQKQTNK